MSEFYEPLQLAADVDELYDGADPAAESLRVLTEQVENEAESKSLPADDRSQVYPRKRGVETVRLLDFVTGTESPLNGRAPVAPELKAEK